MNHKIVFLALAAAFCAIVSLFFGFTAYLDQTRVRPPDYIPAGFWAALTVLFLVLGSLD